MKIEEFNGFLNFKNNVHNFSFKENKVTIHPCSIEECNIFCNEFFKLNLKRKNKWIDTIVLKGVTDKKKGVYFFVSDSPFYYNGYYSYSVDYMYIYDINPETSDMYPIDGLKFKGEEINYIYDVKDYIKQDFKLKGNTFNKYSIELNSKEDKIFGKFKFYNYNITIKGSFSWRKSNDTYSPLEVESMLILNFSHSCNDIQKVINLINCQKKVLYYTCYRKNIVFKEINTYLYTKDNLRSNTGSIYIFNIKDSVEEDNKIIKQIIDLNNVNDKFSEIYKLVIKNKLYLEHICNSSYDRHIYTTSRILSILIAFEHCFKNFYPKVQIQSDEFNIAKNEIINILEDKVQESRGKLKIKYKKLKNSINKINVEYSEHLKYALKDHFDVLEPFIKKIYDVKNPKKVIVAFADRTNTIRNQIAHGSLDNKYKVINSKDIHLMELLIYSISLKYIGLDKKTIQTKLQTLFNITI